MTSPMFFGGEMLFIMWMAILASRLKDIAAALREGHSTDDSKAE